jgi:hypothetical protein
MVGRSIQNRRQRQIVKDIPEAIGGALAARLEIPRTTAKRRTDLLQYQRPSPLAII